MEAKIDEQFVSDPDGRQISAGLLTLGIEKFKRPIKNYALIWMYTGRAWLAKEDETPYKRKRDAVAAGSMLADRLGCKFSEGTR